MTVAPAAEWKPRNEHWESAVREVFAAQGALELIGAELGELAPGLIEVVLPCTPRVAQQHGAVHGGMIGLIADTAGALAGFSVAPAGMVGVTVEYKLSLLAPARGERLVARGHLLRAGNPISVSACDVYGVAEDGSETLVATALLTLAGSRGRSSS